MDFREADLRYSNLKQRYDDGSLSAEEFDTQLEQIMGQDGEGRWWAKSRETGEWHYYDDVSDTWARGIPPNYQQVDYDERYEPGVRSVRSQRQPAPVGEPVTAEPRWGQIGVAVLLAGTVPFVLTFLTLLLTPPIGPGRTLYFFFDFVFHLLALPLGVWAGFAWPGRHPQGYALLGLAAGAIEIFFDSVAYGFIFAGVLAMGPEDFLAVIGIVVLFFLGGILADLWKRRNPAHA